MKIIARGAEAVLYKKEKAGLNILVKKRIKKRYRVDVLDEKLRSERTREEARLISDSRRAGVPTPQIFGEEKFKISMKFLKGKRVKDIIEKISETERTKMSRTIGEYIGKLHSFGIIHGDLTTSNMIFDDDVYFIDFGLGEYSKSIEKKAVDLYLLKRTIESTHTVYMDQIWNNILRGYKKTYKQFQEIFKRMEEIEKRGRYVKR